MTRDEHLLEDVLRKEIYSRMKPREKVKLKIKHE